ncbi:hypothetical protein D3C85_954630 [compost metagenome]
MLTQLSRQGQHQAQATGGQGVAECQRTTLDVQTRRVQLQLLRHCQDLGGLGFVDFKAVDPIQAQAAALQQQANRRCRTDAHELWRHPDHRAGPQQGQRCIPTGRSAPDQGRRRAIDHRTTVAGGLHPAFVHGAQPGQRRDVSGPWVAVFTHRVDAA